MTYSNTWSTTRPLGSAQASSIDDEIRALRLDIQERMNNLVVDWSADPVVLRQDIVGNVVGKKQLIHANAFTIEPDESNVFEYQDTGAQVGQDVGPLRASVTLPIGSIITQIRWLVTGGDTAAVSLALMGAEFDTALAQSTEQSMSSTETGVSIVDSGSISVTIVDTKAYYLRIDKSTGAPFTIHSVEITYTAPDVRNTI